MSDEQQQPVVDTQPETPAPTETPAVESPDARNEEPSLNDILSEFGQGGQEPAPTPEPGADNALHQRLEKLEADIALQQFATDIKPVVETIRGDLPAELFDDTLVQAWLDARAKEDPRLANAWMNRHNKPAEFNRAIGKLGQEFSKKYGSMPDKAATEDREAVAQAVRGASTKAPDNSAPPDFSGMSDGEYREAVRKEYGFDPGV